MGVGAELDLDLGPIMADLAVELGRMNDRDDDAAAERRRREHVRALIPADVRLVTVGTIPSPTARSMLSVGGPDAGYFWLVRRILVGGLTFKTTAAGTAEIYVTGLSGSVGSVTTGPIVSGLALSDLVDQYATLPKVVNYTSHQIIVQEGENLCAVVDTGTAGQQYVMAAQLQVVRRSSQADLATAS